MEDGHYGNGHVVYGMTMSLYGNVHVGYRNGHVRYGNFHIEYGETGEFCFIMTRFMEDKISSTP